MADPKYKFKIDNLPFMMDYSLALEHGCWAFFFMRGAEAYYAGRKTSPVYKHNQKAQLSWKDGYNTALAHEEKTLERVPESALSNFCRGFSNPMMLTDSAPEKLGIYMRHLYELVPFEPNNQEREYPMLRHEVLYKVVGSDDIFGTEVGTDTKGRMLLEHKVTGIIKAYDVHELEEQVPFTVELLCGTDRNHYLSNKGEVKIGDVVLIRSISTNRLEFAEVMAVNTKKREVVKKLSSVMKGIIAFVKHKEDVPVVEFAVQPE